MPSGERKGPGMVPSVYDDIDEGVYGSSTADTYNTRPIDVDCGDDEAVIVHHTDLQEHTRTGKDVQEVYRVKDNIRYHDIQHQAIDLDDATACHSKTLCGHTWTTRLRADAAKSLNLTACKRCFKAPTKDKDVVQHVSTKTTCSTGNLVRPMGSASVATPQTNSGRDQDPSLYTYKIGSGKSYHRKVSFGDLKVACHQPGSKPAERVTELGSLEPCKKCYDVASLESSKTPGNVLRTTTHTALERDTNNSNTHRPDQRSIQHSNTPHQTGNTAGVRSVRGGQGTSEHSSDLPGIHLRKYRIGNGKTYHRKTHVTDHVVVCGHVGGTAPVEVTSPGTLRPCLNCYKSDEGTTRAVSSTEYPHTRARTSGNSNTGVQIATNGRAGGTVRSQVRANETPRVVNSSANTRSTNTATSSAREGGSVIGHSVPASADAKYKIGNGKKYHRKVGGSAGVFCNTTGKTAPAVASVEDLEKMTPCAKCFK